MTPLVCSPPAAWRLLKSCKFYNPSVALPQKICWRKTFRCSAEESRISIFLCINYFQEALPCFHDAHFTAGTLFYSNIISSRLTLSWVLQAFSVVQLKQSVTLLLGSNFFCSSQVCHYCIFNFDYLKYVHVSELKFFERANHKIESYMSL